MKTRNFYKRNFQLLKTWIKASFVICLMLCLSSVKASAQGEPGMLDMPDYIFDVFPGKKIFSKVLYDGGNIGYTYAYLEFECAPGKEYAERLEGVEFNIHDDNYLERRASISIIIDESAPIGQHYVRVGFQRWSHTETPDGTVTKIEDVPGSNYFRLHIEEKGANTKFIHVSSDSHSFYRGEGSVSYYVDTRNMGEIKAEGKEITINL